MDILSIFADPKVLIIIVISVALATFIYLNWRRTSGALDTITSLVETQKQLQRQLAHGVIVDQRVDPLKIEDASNMSEETMEYEYESDQESEESQEDRPKQNHLQDLIDHHKQHMHMQIQTQTQPQPQPQPHAQPQPQRQSQSQLRDEIIIDDLSDELSEESIEFRELDDWTTPVSLNLEQKIKEDMELIDKLNESTALSQGEKVKEKIKVFPKVQKDKPSIKPKISLKIK